MPGIAFACFSIATGAFVSLVGTRQWFQDHIRAFLVLGFLGQLAATSRTSSCKIVAAFRGSGDRRLATGLLEPAWDSLFTDAVERTSAKHWSIWSGAHTWSQEWQRSSAELSWPIFPSSAVCDHGFADTLATFLAWRGDLPKGTRNLLKNAPASVTGD